VRDLIRGICGSQDVQIAKGHVRPDHVHLMLSMPPQVWPCRIMWAVKGRSSRRLVREYHRLQRDLWGRHLWARGYFACTTGKCD
jgi:putative transposase